MANFCSTIRDFVSSSLRPKDALTWLKTTPWTVRWPRWHQKRSAPAVTLFRSSSGRSTEVAHLAQRSPPHWPRRQPGYRSVAPKAQRQRTLCSRASLDATSHRALRPPIPSLRFRDNPYALRTSTVTNGGSETHSCVATELKCMRRRLRPPLWRHNLRRNQNGYRWVRANNQLDLGPF